MKKNMMRIFATAGAVVALVFVIVLLVTVFGGIEMTEFDNSLVKGLFVTLGAIFALLTALTLAMLFINDELVKEIVLRSDKDGGTRTTVGVVKNITKKTVALVEGVKCTKCAIVVNEYGVRLKITVSVKERDVREVENYLRALLEDAFMGALHFRFYSIEIKVKKLKPKHVVEAQEIMAKADEAEAVRQAEEEARRAKEEAEKQAADAEIKALYPSEESAVEIDAESDNNGSDEAEGITDEEVVLEASNAEEISEGKDETETEEATAVYETDDTEEKTGIESETIETEIVPSEEEEKQ